MRDWLIKKLGGVTRKDHDKVRNKVWNIEVQLQTTKGLLGTAKYERGTYQTMNHELRRKIQPLDQRILELEEMWTRHNVTGEINYWRQKYYDLASKEGKFWDRIPTGAIFHEDAWDSRRPAYRQGVLFQRGDVGVTFLADGDMDNEERLRLTLDVYKKWFHDDFLPQVYMQMQDEIKKFYKNLEKA